MENTITTDHDKQLQLLDRAITYATATEIPLNEAWKTVNELLTTEVTLGERLQNYYGICKTILELEVNYGKETVEYKCQLLVNHGGMHQTSGGSKFACSEK